MEKDKCRIKLLLTLILFLGIATLVSACKGWKKVQVYYDEYTDFTQYVSFYWHDSFHQQGSNGETGLLETQLKRSLVNELQQRGYSMNPHNPDLLVSVIITTEKKTGYRTVPTNYGGDYGDYAVVPYTYYERTTILRLIDPDKGNTVWEGLMTATQQDQVERKYHKIEKNVLKIMKEFQFRGNQSFY